MTLNDRFTRGFIAGVGAGVVQAIFMYTAETFNLTNLIFRNFMSVFVYGNKVHTFHARAFSELMLMGWMGLLGVFFAYSLTFISSENIRFKGAVYGISIWMFSYFMTTLYQVHPLEHITFKTAVTNAAISAIWGIALAQILLWLDRKVSAD